MARRHLSKKQARGLAEQQAGRLFELAETEARAGKDDRARRYVSLALRVSERYKAPARHKRTYCPSCHAFFVPPRNVRVRTGKRRLSLTCLQCGHIQRFPIGHEWKGREDD
jgi:ribonuclease P protein subunit RPR2